MLLKLLTKFFVLRKVDILLEKKICSRIANLLYYMYSNQLCDVKCGDETSASFAISNGVKQGSVILPFTIQ